MSLQVTVHSTGSAGRQFEIAFEKTGPDTGVIDIKSWNAGQNPSSDPAAEDETVNVHDIKALSTTGITCHGPSFLGSDPVFTCGLYDGSATSGPFVQVIIKGTPFGHWDGTTDYSVIPEDLLKLKKFFSDAGFPSAG